MKDTWTNQRWNRWFAWYPVECDIPRSSIDSRKFVWLKPVWRFRKAQGFGYVFGYGFHGPTGYKDHGWVYISYEPHGQTEDPSTGKIWEDQGIILRLAAMIR